MVKFITLIFLSLSHKKTSKNLASSRNSHHDRLHSGRRKFALLILELRPIDEYLHPGKSRLTIHVDM